MNTDKEFRERFGDDPDGLVTKYLTLDFEDDDSYLVKVPTALLKLVGDKDSSKRFIEMDIKALLFKGLFNQLFNAGEDIEDICVYIEVKGKKFHKEWQATVENSAGGFYKFSDEEVEDERTRIVPAVHEIEKGEENEK